MPVGSIIDTVPVVVEKNPRRLLQHRRCVDLPQAYIHGDLWQLVNPSVRYVHSRPTGFRELTATLSEITSFLVFGFANGWM